MRGISTLIAAILLLAVTVAMGFTVALTLESEHRKMLEISKSLEKYIKLENEKMEIVNPAHPIKLDEIKLFIDGELVNLRDENGDGLWSTWEKITVNNVKDRNYDGMIEVKLIINNKEIFYGVFAEQFKIYSDKNYPMIKILKMEVLDDYVLVTYLTCDDVGIYYTEVVESDYKMENKSIINVNLLKKTMEQLNLDYRSFIKNLNDEIKAFEKNEVKGEILDKLSAYTCTFLIPKKSLEQIAYVTIYVRDLSGKVSSEVIRFDEVRKYLNISVRIIHPKDGSVFLENTTIPIKIVVTGASKINLYINNETVLSRIITDSYSTINYNVTLEKGIYVISALASNRYFNVTDTVVIRVEEDKPPKVKIVYPFNNSVIHHNLSIVAVVRDDRGIKYIEVILNSEVIDRIRLNSVKKYKYEKTIEVSPGNYTLIVKAVDLKNQTGLDSVRFALLKVVDVKIYSPTKKEQFFVGDPEIVVISKGTDKIDVFVDNVKINGIKAKMMDRKFISTGWFFGKEIYVPKIFSFSGKMRIEVKKIPASNFFESIFKRGYSNSKGIKFELDLPCKSELIFKFGIVYGKARPRLIHYSISKSSNAIKYTYIYGWQVPENSVPLENLRIKFKPVCWKLDSELKYYFLLIFDTKIEIYSSGKLIQNLNLGTIGFGKTVSMDMWEWEKGVPPVTKEVEIKALDVMRISFYPIKIEGAPLGCGGISFDPISYATVAEGVEVIIDGKVVSRFDLNPNKPSRDLKLVLGQGKHKIEIKSENGAFSWKMEAHAIQEVGAENVIVTLPSGRKVIVHGKSEWISAEFGLFKFNRPCVAKIDYLISSEPTPGTDQFEVVGIRTIALFPGVYKLQIKPDLIIRKLDNIVKIKEIESSKQLERSYRTCFGFCFYDYPSWSKYWHLWKEGVIYSTSRPVEIEGHVKANAGYMIGVGFNALRGKIFYVLGGVQFETYGLKRITSNSISFKARIIPNGLSEICVNGKCLKGYTFYRVNLYVKVNYADQTPWVELGPWGVAFTHRTSWANGTVKDKIKVSYKLRVKFIQKPDYVSRKISNVISSVVLKSRYVEEIFHVKRTIKLFLTEPGVLLINAKGQAVVRMSTEKIAEIYRKLYAFYSWYVFKSDGLHEVRAIAYGIGNAEDKIKIRVKGLTRNLKPEIIVLSSDVAEKGWPYEFKARLVDDKRIIAGEIWIDGKRIFAKSFNDRDCILKFQTKFSGDELGYHRVKFVAYDNDYQRAEKCIKILVKNKVRRPIIEKIIIKKAIGPVYPKYSAIKICGETELIRGSYPSETAIIVEAIVKKGDYDVAYVKWGSLDNINSWPKYVNPCETNPSKIWWWNWGGNARPSVSYSEPYETVVFLREPWFYEMQYQIISAVACDVKGFCGRVKSIEIIVEPSKSEDVTPPVVKIIEPKTGEVVSGIRDIKICAKDNRGISEVYILAYRKDNPKRIINLGSAGVEDEMWKLSINFSHLYELLGYRSEIIENRPILIALVAYAKDLGGNLASDKVELILSR